MTKPDDKKPRVGDVVVLIEIPPGLLNDLPSEDQEAIREVVGKSIKLSGYEGDGRAELEFKDRGGTVHFVYVEPRYIRKS